MTDLTVCSVVFNDNVSQLFDLTMQSILKFTNPTPKFIICDNGGNSGLSDYPNTRVVKNKPTMAGGSNAHGEALNKIIPMVDTKYCAIIESDCMVLENINLLTGSHPLVAVPKSTDLYHIFFLVGETERLKKVNFMPKRPINEASYLPRNDVASRIKDKFSLSEISLLTFVSCKTGKGNVYDKTFQSDEVHWNGKTIVTHFGRGSDLGGKIKREGFQSPQKQLKRWREIGRGLLDGD